MIEAQRWWSGRETLVTMMQTADPGQGNDLPGTGRLNRSSIRCVLAERQVGPRTVIIVEVRAKNAPQMPLIEDDHVVQAFPSNGADHTFNIRVLPW